MVIIIIVSQDKTEIVNFEKILSIKMYHDENDKDCLYELYCCVKAPGDNYILIGIYKTEERAMEVLQEIIEQYKKICNNSYFLVYEMPEE